MLDPKIFEAMHQFTLEEKFRGLREGIAEEIDKDETKALMVLGLSLLETFLTDLHRSADALEKIASNDAQRKTAVAQLSDDLVAAGRADATITESSQWPVQE